MRAERATYRALVCLLVCALGSACGGGDDDGGDGGDDPICIETLPADCVMGFPATWDRVHNFVIQQSCGGPNGPTCHGPEGRQGDLVLFDKEAAYRALLGTDGTHARVEPGDPACSPLMERLTTDDPVRRMPQGGKLDDSTICAVQKWIEQGALQ